MEMQDIQEIRTLELCDGACLDICVLAGALLVRLQQPQRGSALVLAQRAQQIGGLAGRRSPRQQHPEEQRRLVICLMPGM